MWVPTYLRYLPYIDLPERQDKETDSPVSPTPKSRSRIEVRADHSLPNLPYLVPSNIKYVQQSSPVQSSPRASATTTTTRCSQSEKAVHPRYLYLAHPIPFHPIPPQHNPRVSTTIRAKYDLDDLDDDNILQDRSAASVQVQVQVHVPKACRLPYLNMYIGTGTYLKLKPGFAHSSSSCERTPQGGISVGLFQLYNLPATVPVVPGCSNHHHHHHHSTTWFTCTS